MENEMSDIFNCSRCVTPAKCAIHGCCPNTWPAEQPIDMVLHCPACGLQHIDAPDTEPSAHPDGRESKWDNPPHRSHLCHGCGHIWRPADVPTNGVAAVKTRGKNDSPIVKR